MLRGVWTSLAAEYIHPTKHTHIQYSIGGIDLKIVIPGELPDLNTIIKASKSHYGAYSKLKKDNTNKVTWLAKKLPKMKCIDLEITWYCENKKKDKDNIAAGIKFILDGLVEAGTIENDGWKQINDFTHRFEIDRENPRIEVEISEVV